MRTWAILVAAGAGARLGGDRPKAFAALGGRPLLAESLERLDASDWIDAIVVAAPPEWEEPAILLAEELVASKVAAVVTGGATRADSVRIALAEVPEDALVVLVHDAARPLVDDDVIERVLARLGEGRRRRVPGFRSRTRSSASSGGVGRRDARPREPRRRARRRRRSSRIGFAPPSPASSADATDCASLVERDGGRVGVVDGRPAPVKVTTAADLELVERLLACRLTWRSGPSSSTSARRSSTRSATGARWRDAAGVGPHVVWAALGETIERGEEHWRALGSSRPRAPGGRRGSGFVYSLDDLYPGRARRASSALRQPGLLVGLAGNQNAALGGVGARGRAAVDVVTGSASLGVRKPDPAFFGASSSSPAATPAEVAYVGDRVDNDVAAGAARAAWSRSTCDAARGAAPASRRRRRRDRRARRAPSGASVSA